MNRRKALKNIGFSLGAVSATPTLVSLLSSCQNEINWSPKLLSNSQIDFISNYIELIIPKTKDIPGGLDLGLHKWVDICAKWRPYVTIGDDTPTINGLPTPSRGGGK